MLENANSKVVIVVSLVDSKQQLGNVNAYQEDVEQEETQ